MNAKLTVFLGSSSASPLAPHQLLLSCKITVWSIYLRSVSNSFTYHTQLLTLLILPGISPFSLHGRLQSAAYTNTLTSFAAFHATPSAPAALLATNFAAQGFDIPNVGIVLQIDPPSDPHFPTDVAGQHELGNPDVQLYC